MMQYLWLTKLPFLTAFSVSLMLCIALVRFSQALSRLTRSHDLSSVQAAHTKPTLRLAGVAIFGSMCLADSIYGASGGALRMLLLACLPVFAFGLLEDIGVDQSPARRLIASIISGAIYIALTGSYLSDPGIFWLQPIFDYWFVAIPFTLFVVAGLVNAFNLIDGLNGLTGFTALTACTGVAVIAYKAGFPDIIFPCMVVCAAVIGFMFVNFPYGKLFLGDSGAYSTGFILSSLSLATLNAAPMVSPWAMLMVFFWPIADTIFTILRRIKSGRPVGQPDRLHFHQVVMRIIEISPLGRKGLEYSNPTATMVILPLMVTPPIFGVLFWDRNSLCLMLFWVFLMAFLIVYVSLVRSAFRFKRGFVASKKAVWIAVK